MVGMMPRAPSVVATGACSASASARTSGPACDAAAPSPATIAMRRAAGQRRGGALDVAVVGHRPVRRDAPRLGVDDRRLGGLAELDLVALHGP